MRNYLAEMLYALTSAYSRKDYDNLKRGSPPETNIGKLFSVFAWGLDIVQEQADLIKLWDNLDNARGSVLDRYGANFGVQRLGTTDEFYRLAIKVKLMSQLSGGDSDTVIKAVSALLDVKPSDVVLEDVFPSKIALYVDKKLISQDLLALIEPIANAIKRILAAGVGMRLYLRTYHTYRCDLNFLRIGYTDTKSGTQFIGEDRRISQPFRVARGGAQRSRVYTTPPDVRKALTGHQRGTGGAIYHTRITSKRID